MRRPASRLASFLVLTALGACADAPPADQDQNNSPSNPGLGSNDGGSGSGNNNGGSNEAGSSGSGNGSSGSGNGSSGSGNGSSGSGSGSGSSSDGGSSGGGLDGGTKSDAATPAGGSGCALKPNKDGWIDVASNGAHVQGAVYTYASTGSTINPLTSMTMPFSTGAEGKLCVKGEAAKVLDMNYSMYFGAALAFDLCQASSASPMKYPVGTCPLGKGLGGIRFKLSGTTIPSQLRVQFHEEMRDQSAYVLAQAGQNEALFKDGKVIYDTMAPPVNVDKIDSIHFAIPTTELSTTPFDFCVEDIEFVMTSGSCVGTGNTMDAGTSDGGTNSSDGGTTSDAGKDAGSDAGQTAQSCSKAGAWTTTDRFAERNYGKYVVRNNFWNPGAQGAGTQTLWANSERCWGVDANHANGDGNVKSYANVTRGWAKGTAGFKNSQHGLAVRVSDLRKAKVRWKMQAQAPSRMWGLWDIYFHENANPGADRAPVNLMIQQLIEEEGDRYMITSSANWPKVTIAGVAFRESREAGSSDPNVNDSATRQRIRLYVDVPNGNALGRDDMTIDLKAIIDYYVQQNLIRGTDYLTSIQAGYEIVRGGAYQTNEFWTAVQDEPDGP